MVSATAVSAVVSVSTPAGCVSVPCPATGGTGFEKAPPVCRSLCTRTWRVAHRHSVRGGVRHNDIVVADGVVAVRGAARGFEGAEEGAVPPFSQLPDRAVAGGPQQLLDGVRAQDSLRGGAYLVAERRARRVATAGEKL